MKVFSKRTKEKVIEGFLGGSASITVFTTLAIIVVLLYQSLSFFSEVSVIEFLTDKQWTPLFTDKHFGILSLLSGTLLTTLIAIAFAIPIGLSIAIFLNEYSSKKFRRSVKPLLELLAAVPTVVYGFFALIVVTPFLQTLIPGMATFNSLSAGLVMGIMIIPYVSSLSEDALYAVPFSLREASYGMGSTRFQTAFRVTIPAASSGIVVSVILAISRAIGETMIVTIAAGQQPNLTANPLVPIETMTAYIVQVSHGDVQHGTIEYETIYVVGLTLFIFTFLLNTVSHWMKNKYRQEYE